MKTYNAKPGEIARHWYVVDADGQTLGRLATRIADQLRGKGKPEYTPHVDTGDFVIVGTPRRSMSPATSSTRSATTGTPASRRSCRTLREQLDRRPEGSACRGEGNAPEEPVGPAADHEAQDLCGTGHPHGPQAPEPLKWEEDEPDRAVPGTGKRKDFRRSRDPATRRREHTGSTGTRRTTFRVPPTGLPRWRRCRPQGSRAPSHPRPFTAAA
jgi:large subunit ribosomal protein L13